MKVQPTISNAFKDGQLSFVEVKSEFKVENSITSTELMTLENSLKEMFLNQINNRRKKRYTKSGKLCASIFVQDKITYFDCTDAKSPDGKNEKREWCYIDVYARDGKDWDYCKPIIDYDKIREKNQYQLHVITVEARKINDDLFSLIGRSDALIKQLKDVRDGHAELDLKILQMRRATKATEYNLSNLYVLEAKWKNAEINALDIGKDIDKAEADMKKEETKATISNKSWWPTEKAVINKQENVFNQYINELILRREKIKKVDCNGLEGYERDGSGGGLQGEYFDNEQWIGKGIKKKDPRINFSWNGASPIDGINPYNYSVKWTGFLKAPYSGRYIFSVETGDSVMITINNRIVIAHNMRSAKSESQGRNNNWLANEVYIAQHPYIDRNKARSENIYLLGGYKYK